MGAGTGVGFAVGCRPEVCARLIATQSAGSRARRGLGRRRVRTFLSPLLAGGVRCACHKAASDAWRGSSDGFGVARHTEVGPVATGVRARRLDSSRRLRTTARRCWAAARVVARSQAARAAATGSMSNGWLDVRKKERKKERKQTTQGRDGRTVHRHHTGISRRGQCGASRHLPLGACLFLSLFAVCRRFSLQPSCHPAVFLLSTHVRDSPFFPIFLAASEDTSPTRSTIS